jgi:hypothetical protein
LPAAAARVLGTTPGPVRARRREHAVVAGQVRAGLWHQCNQSGDQVLGLDKIAGSDFGQPKAGPKGAGQDARSNPELSATSRRGPSGSAGSVCSVKTFCPSLGPVAIRYVIDAPSRLLIGASSPGSNARYAFSMSRVMSP